MEDACRSAVAGSSQNENETIKNSNLNQQVTEDSNYNHRTDTGAIHSLETLANQSVENKITRQEQITKTSEDNKIPDDTNMKKSQKKTITLEISNDIDILLIGKTGAGKSALGNSLLTGEAFVSSANIESVTDEIKEAYGVFEGRVLKVVDTPGVCDTRMTNEDGFKKFSENMQNAVNINTMGYHVLIYVLKFGERFTQEDITALHILKKIFGSNFVNNFVILVLTCGDNFEKQVTKKTGFTFEKWCTQQQGVFQQLLEECEGRVVLFDNFAEEVEKIHNQKRDLINVIDRLQSSGKRYTNKYFDQAMETRHKLLIECKIPALKDKIFRETGVIMSSYNQMNFQDPENKIEELEKMQAQSIALLTEIEEEDKESGALTNLLETVRSVSRTLEEQINTCKLLIREREKSKKEQHRLEQQMQKDKEFIKLQEKKFKREHQQLILQIELNKKSMKEFEKQRKDDNEKYENCLKRQKEIEELKFKQIQLESEQKQESFIKKIELQKIEIESEKQKLSAKRDLEKQDLLRQTDIDQHEFQLLEDVKKEEEEKILKLELKQKQREINFAEERIQCLQDIISNDIDILLIGKTGKGKSALGNSLLSSEAFLSSANFESVTDVIKDGYGVFEGRILKVVDTPGVCDTRMSEEDALKMVSDKMQDAVNLNPVGYHTLIYVLKFGERFTEEDVTAIQILKKIFGNDFVNKFGILVLTCGDNFEKQVTKKTGFTFEKWCTQQQGVFQQLLEECEGRVVLFDNFAEEVEKIHKQKSELINMIDRLQSSGKRYTNKHFDDAKETRDKLLIECKIPALKDKIFRETGVIMSSYNQMNFQDPENKIEELEKMQAQSIALLTEIEEEDKESGALTNLLETVRNVSRTLEEQINTCKLLIQEREKSKKEQHRLEQQMQKDKEFMEMQEEKSKREHQQLILQIELNKKSMEEFEKQRKDDKEKYENDLKRQKEIEELKFKQIQLESEQKQESIIKEIELQKNAIESERQKFLAKIELEKQDLLRQKDFDQQKLQLLKDAAKKEQEEKRLELELKQKEMNAAEERHRIEKEAQKNEYLKLQKEEEKKIQMMEEKAKRDHEAHIKELLLKEREIEAAEKKQLLEIEKIKDEMKKQNEIHIEKIKCQQRKDQMENDLRIQEMKLKEQEMRANEIRLSEEREAKTRAEIRMLNELMKEAADRRHIKETEEIKQEYELRRQMEELRNERLNLERQTQQIQFIEALQTERERTKNENSCNIQ